MKMLKVVSLSLLLVLGLAGCDLIANMVPTQAAEIPGGDESEPANNEEEGETVVITPAIQGNTAELAIGDTLVVQIPTIPTEGFSWMAQDLNTNILIQQGEPLYKTQTGPDAGGGMTVLTFKAVGSGETQLNLDYAKPGSGREPGLTKDTFGITVIVRGEGGDTVAVRPEIQGTSASLIVGDTLVVEIPTIPSEGFEWVVEKVDTSILMQEGGAEYKRDTRSADAAGGITYLRFKAVGPGETNLGLAYASEGTEDLPAMSKQTLGVNVTVREPAE
jgi:predicted secreted protein